VQASDVDEAGETPSADVSGFVAAFGAIVMGISDFILA